MLKNEKVVKTLEMINPSEAGACFTHLPLGRGFSAIP